MAEIRDELVLEIDQALRAIDQIEQALNRSLGAVEIRVDATQAQRQLDQLAQAADQALGDVDVNIDATGAARLNDELAGVERNLAQADDNADDLASSVRRVDRAASDVNDTTKDMSGSFGKLESIAKGLLSAFAALGAAQLFGSVARGANAAVQQFAILEDSVNAVNVIFGNASESVLEFGETAAKSAGLSQSAFNQAVTPLGALLQNFGFDAREAADASVILVQRAADLASVLGGDVQTALAAVSSALRGQSEPLTAYGATISAARVEQFALANGLAATKAEITDAITLQARYGLILEDTNRVAGDYANTAGDLANAQRTLGGLATDLAAEVGEALAPAFEALLAQGPGLIALFASLTPALADAAGNAAAAASGFQVGATNTVLGIGGITNALGSFANLVQAGAEGIKGIGLSLNPFREAGEEFADFNIQLDEFNNNIAQDFINNAGLQIPRAIQAGITPVNAFGIAIASLAQKDDSLETIQLGFERLAIQSDLTDAELQAVTSSLLAQADTLELNADEIAFLTGQLNGLNETLDDGGRANADYLASVAGFPGVFNTTTTTFTTFAGATETAQERATAALTQLSIDAEAQATRTANAFDLFADAPDAIAESFTSAVDDLREQVEAAAGFEANLALLAAEGLDALVAEFREQGPAAATQVVQALDDLDLAREADQLLQGIAGPAIDGFGEEFVQELVNRGLDQTTAEALAATLNSPAVIDAVTEAGNQSAVAGVTAYGVGIQEEMSTFAAETDFANLLAGALTNAELLQSMADAGAKAAQAYEDGFRGPNGLNAFSPSKVFMEIGKDAVDGFNLGWDQNATTLRVPETGVTGNLVNTTAAANTGSGVNVTLITNNPTQQDEVSDVARMGQIASSVAASYRSVVPNGM